MISNQARERLLIKKIFYAHLKTYFIIMSLMAIINVLVFPADLWFRYPLVIWGATLFSHFFIVFVLYRWRYSKSERIEVAKEMKRIQMEKPTTSSIDDSLELSKQPLVKGMGLELTQDRIDQETV